LFEKERISAKLLIFIGFLLVRYYISMMSFYVKTRNILIECANIGLISDISVL